MPEETVKWPPWMTEPIEDGPLFDAKAKVWWGQRCLHELDSRFRDFVKPGGGDERPLGVGFHAISRTTILARFIAEDPLPVELSLIASDAVHNTRVALDQVVAALKRELGGDPGQGGFPVYVDGDDWEQQVEGNKRNPLRGLPDDATGLIKTFQPFLGSSGENDPLLVLNRLDNTDKHRQLSLAYVYPGVDRGVDLIDVLERKRPVQALNLWNVGEPLANGTKLARYTFVGGVRELSQQIRVRAEQDIRCTIGEIGKARTSFTAMIHRVCQVIEDAEQLLGTSG